MLRLPEKNKHTANLKSKLRTITGLGMFYRDNVEFKPHMLLQQINVLKTAVWGELKDDETHEGRPPKGKHAKVAGMFQLVQYLMDEFKQLFEH